MDLLSNRSELQFSCHNKGMRHEKVIETWARITEIANGGMWRHVGYSWAADIHIWVPRLMASSIVIDMVAVAPSSSVFSSWNARQLEVEKFLFGRSGRCNDAEKITIFIFLNACFFFMRSSQNRLPTCVKWNHSYGYCEESSESHAITRLPQVSCLSHRRWLGRKGFI